MKTKTIKPYTVERFGKALLVQKTFKGEYELCSVFTGPYIGDSFDAAREALLIAADYPKKRLLDWKVEKTEEEAKAGRPFWMAVYPFLSMDGNETPCEPYRAQNAAMRGGKPTGYTQRIPVTYTLKVYLS